MSDSDALVPHGHACFSGRCPASLRALIFALQRALRTKSNIGLQGASAATAGCADPAGAGKYRYAFSTIRRQRIFCSSLPISASRRSRVFD